MASLDQLSQSDPDYRRAIARAMMMQGIDTSPVQHWTQGAARIAQALVGGLGMNAIKSEDSAAVNSVLDAALHPQYPATPSSPPATGMGDPANAISSIESGGKYDLLGPVTKTGDRAYGKYQVMGQNVGPWTQAALGQQMTPQQFLANPQAQDAVFKAKFGEYSNKYGPEGAARAWFAGEGGMNNPNARDQLGTTVAQYGQKFAQAMGPNNGPTLAAPQRQEPTVPPNIANAIRGALMSNSGRAQNLGAQLLREYVRPQEYGFQTLPDGTIVRTSKTTGDVAPVYGFNKPQLQTIKTPNGEEITAWVNPSYQTAKPVQIPGMSQGPATVMGPDGKPIAVPQGQNAKAFIQQVTKNSADAMSGKLTEEQAKSTQFANRMEEAEQNAKQFQGNYNNKMDAAAQWAGEHPLSPVPRAAANMVTSEPYQKLQQSKSQFITALLRRESGAAINRDEFIRYDREFFPQVGDGPEVVAQKEQARKTAIAAMQKTAGPAYKSPQSVSGGGPVRKFNPATGKIE